MVGVAVLTPWRSIGNVVLLVDSHDRFMSKMACERSMTPVARGSAGNPC